MKKDPSSEYLILIAEGEDRFPDNLFYSKKRKLGIKDWCREYQKDSTYKRRPGDFLSIENTRLKFNNKHLPIYTLEEFKKKMNVTNKKNWLSYEEKYRLATPNQVLKHMVKNNVKPLHKNL